MFKTRGLAGEQVGRGRVRVTRAGRTARVAKPHYGVRPGDVLSLARAGELIVLEITALPARRGPAAEARACYSRLVDASPAPPGGD